MDKSKQPQLTITDIFNSTKVPLDGAGKKLISEAFVFANHYHSGQVRRSGEPYIQHSLATAQILAGLGMDANTIAAGILHDVPEDTAATSDDVREKFGKEISWMVDGVTKLGHIRLQGSREEIFVENLRKMFLAMAADIRVVIVKLCDRLHNMRTLEFVSPEKQERIAKETMEVYAQIANRLGMSEIKSELEDLSFEYLYPDEYRKVRKLYLREKQDYEKYITRAIKVMRQKLAKEKVKIISIKGRAKSLYSLYIKLQRYDFDISRIYDIVAIRIIVSEIAGCYETLGIVHKKYRPMVGRIKDYISLPKPNGYQSIHTTVFGPEGRIIEVQIRTPQMHNEAELGIAAHWLYKEQKRLSWKRYFTRGKEAPIEQTNRLNWVKQLQEWQMELGGDNEEFMKSLRIDFFRNHIFAFTPKGDIIDLPEDSTPIDFAYAIHTEVGARATGAKIDGKMVSLDTPIKNGQVVEILTVKNPKLPSRSWLDFVKTSSARSHIKRELKRAGKKL